MRVYIVDLEPVETRYTKQWKDLLPIMMEQAGINAYSVSGPAIPQIVTPGAFLNFAGTNSYKASQIQWISELLQQPTNELCPKDGDYFLYTDAWNPTVIQLKYMIELLGLKIRVGGLWHAGSYDPQDFLGRLIGDKPWVRNAEASMFHCFDDNFFATRFHANMFLKELLGVEVLFGEDELDEWITHPNNPSIKLVGWPMEYLPHILKPFEIIEKKDKIIFPHRLAPEKQLEIFRDLAEAMPEYEWFVAQEHRLSKEQYHTHLAESRIAFSANLQETLGISMYEAALVGTYPLVPDRLSYSEMWEGGCLYPSAWTENWDSYQQHKQEMISYIRKIMSTNSSLKDTAMLKAMKVGSRFFNGKELYKAIIDSAS